MYTHTTPTPASVSQPQTRSSSVSAEKVMPGLRISSSMIWYSSLLSDCALSPQRSSKRPGSSVTSPRRSTSGT